MANGVRSCRDGLCNISFSPEGSTILSLISHRCDLAVRLAWGTAHQGVRKHGRNHARSTYVPSLRTISSFGEHR